MPNDCYNIIECYHEDTEIIKRLKDALSRDPPAFFAEFIPVSYTHLTLPTILRV